MWVRGMRVHRDLEISLTVLAPAPTPLPLPFKPFPRPLDTCVDIISATIVFKRKYYLR